MKKININNEEDKKMFYMNLEQTPEDYFIDIEI